VRGGYAYWVSRGRLLRRSLASAGPGTVPEQLREDARVGTRVAVPIGASKELASLPPPERPYIVHFVMAEKPWIARMLSPNAAFYDGFRARTLFRRSLREKLGDLRIGLMARAKALARALLRGAS